MTHQYDAGARDPFIDDVFPAELDEIGRRRGEVRLSTSGLHGYPTTAKGLVGLALSGGGIRSATFSLGALQALAQHGVLRFVDYLSTVSGGGFIGSCLSSLLNDPVAEPDGDRFPLRRVEGEPDTPAVQHLRNSQHYLAPGGILDRIRIPALMARGILFNLLLVLPYVMLLVGLTDLVYAGVLRGPASFFSWIPFIAAGAFVLLVATFPVVIRLVGGQFGWAVRNRYESLFAGSFLLVLVAIALVPFFRLVDGAVYKTPEQVLEWVRDPGRDVYWRALAAIAILTVIGIAVPVSPRIAERRTTICLYAVGFLGPAFLLGLYLLLCVIEIDPPAPHGSLLDGVDWRFLSVATGWWLFNAVFGNVNASSAHSFYRDRLSKAYLVRTTGGQQDIGPWDELKLSDLNRPHAKTPYHLINASLNLNGTTDPDVRGRNCDFFVFSKHFTGSRRTGFARTEDLERLHPHLNLGTAVAISGAAAAPNAGVTTVTPLVFILTLLDVRLGYWLPNPGLVQGAPWWRSLQLWLGTGPSYLLREAFGQVSSGGSFVNLSDGGHIENLAIYQLLRRRCRLIIAVDAEQDPTLQFDGLLKVILYAQIDLGVEIQIDLGAIRPKEPGLSHAHCVVGTINYGQARNGDPETGWLLYLKASLTGDEGEAVRGYHTSHPEFPHEPTADQFFNERQWEMYRALGFHIADGTFASRSDTRIVEIQGFLNSLRDHN